MSVLVTAPVHAQSGETIHVVRPGETLSSIAARYGVSYLQLARYNNITNVNHLRVGQRLRIPPRALSQPTVRPRLTPTKTPANNQSPTPRAGATKTPAALRITPRPRTRTPIPTRRPSNSFQTNGLYTVRRGDTLSSIAARYGVTVAAIMQRNRMTSSVIYVGQRLIIPTRGASSPSAPRSTPRPTPSPRVQVATATPPAKRATSTPTRIRLVPTAPATATPGK